MDMETFLAYDFESEVKAASGLEIKALSRKQKILKIDLSLQRKKEPKAKGRNGN